MRLRPVVVVHYHEISLKRGNRPRFLRQLARNLARAIADLGPSTLRQRPGRIVIDLDGHPRPEAVRDRIQRVCGPPRRWRRCRASSAGSWRGARSAPFASRPGAPSRPTR